MDPRTRKVCVCVCPLIEKSIRVRHAAAALNTTPLFAQRQSRRIAAHPCAPRGQRRWPRRPRRSSQHRGYALSAADLEGSAGVAGEKASRAMEFAPPTRALPSRRRTAAFTQSRHRVTARRRAPRPPPGPPTARFGSASTAAGRSRTCTQRSPARPRARLPRTARSSCCPRIPPTTRAPRARAYDACSRR